MFTLLIHLIHTTKLFRFWFQYSQVSCISYMCMKVNLKHFSFLHLLPIEDMHDENNSTTLIKIHKRSYAKVDVMKF